MQYMCTRGTLLLRIHLHSERCKRTKSSNSRPSRKAPKKNKTRRTVSPITTLASHGDPQAILFYFLCPQHSKDKIRVPGTAKSFTSQDLEKGTSLCLTIWVFHGDPQEFFFFCVPDIPRIGLECPELQKKLSKYILAHLSQRLGPG